MDDWRAHVNNERHLLLYAGSCPRCRALARAVGVLSFGTVDLVSLERPEWRKFYYEDFPQAQGFPVLFLHGEPVFGWRVFLYTPRLVLHQWLAAAGLRRRPNEPYQHTHRSV